MHVLDYGVLDNEKSKMRDEPRCVSFVTQEQEEKRKKTHFHKNLFFPYYTNQYCHATVLSLTTLYCSLDKITKYFNAPKLHSVRQKLNAKPQAETSL